MTETAPDQPGTAPASPPLNVTALFAEAASKSGLMWVQPPGDRAWPFWHAWAEDTVYVVSGPGEQTLPWLPEEVTLVARSKDTGGRLLTVSASVREIRPDEERWAVATDALKAGRLNAAADALDRWARECTVRALTPYGAPLEAPGSYDTGSGAAPVPVSEATTSTWRPWHWRGRPRRRRGNRLPDGG
ncbi:hypothetical protein [Phycicoccus sp. Root101]|uniref:hypothetical protein n=1 Tax=Phycicoccus sp. Root101 TaxID=1736421 RepID=UPI000ACACB6C|nr:hypothetical protein [Phycicoccus sp. Root101]